MSLDLEPGDLGPRERVALALELELRDGSCLPDVQVKLRAAETLAKGGAELPLWLRDLGARGALALSVDRDALALRPASELVLRPPRRRGPAVAALGALRGDRRHADVLRRAEHARTRGFASIFPMSAAQG